ncbi:MAG: biotin transporter BioY [Sporomusaceae bacterium]|nr:biotin transporter BioY [Sporomusaceae bacterium]
MSKTLTIKEIALISIFTALTVVLSQIAIPLPFTPVPFSCGVIALYLTGMLLKPKHAFLAQVCYLLLGAAGLPVFANFRGGLGALFGPTGGYLFAYPLVSFLAAFLLNNPGRTSDEAAQSKKRLYAKTGAALTLTHTIFYLAGASWLSVITGSSLTSAFMLAVYPFIPLDILKIAFCVFAVLPLRSRLIANNLLTPVYNLPNYSPESGGKNHARK